MPPQTAGNTEIEIVKISDDLPFSERARWRMSKHMVAKYSWINSPKMIFWEFSPVARRCHACFGTSQELKNLLLRNPNK